jgi:hypothetical protein
MQNGTYLFMVWAHRSADSMFGASSSPVMRNGAFLCFETEEKARAEADRLNAHSGHSHMHYSVKPTLVQILPGGRPKAGSGEPQYAIALSDAPCSNRSLLGRLRPL